MAKKVAGFVKLQIPAGQATPAPPVGTALGPQGINIMAFVKEFNARTQKEAGTILPVEITIFSDKSFTFITKTPPAAVLLNRAAGIAKASAVPHKDKIGKVTHQQVREGRGLAQAPAAKQRQTKRRSTMSKSHGGRSASRARPRGGRALRPGRDPTRP